MAFKQMGKKVKCEHPIRIYYKKEGVKRQSDVPCGRCTNCRINRITQWTIRIQSEMQKTGDATFLTLTYDEDNIPSDNKVNKTHIQKFHKKLRKKGYKFKFFVCGEYGENTHRPHYHGIYCGKIGNHKTILETWGMGNIKIGTVTPASIRYTVSYIMEKRNDEFQLTSKLWGEEWIKENIIDWIYNKKMSHNGKNIPLPKYIKDRYNIRLTTGEAIGEKARLYENLFKTHKVREARTIQQRKEITALEQIILKRKKEEYRRGGRQSL